METKVDLKLLDDLVEENNRLREENTMLTSRINRFIVSAAQTIISRNKEIESLKQLWFSDADPKEVPEYAEEYINLEKP